MAPFHFSHSTGFTPENLTWNADTDIIYNTIQQRRRMQQQKIDAEIMGMETIRTKQLEKARSQLTLKLGSFDESGSDIAFPFPAYMKGTLPSSLTKTSEMVKFGGQAGFGTDIAPALPSLELSPFADGEMVERFMTIEDNSRRGNGQTIVPPLRAISPLSLPPPAIPITEPLPNSNSNSSPKIEWEGYEQGKSFILPMRPKRCAVQPAMLATEKKSETESQGNPRVEWIPYQKGKLIDLPIRLKSPASSESSAPTDVRKQAEEEVRKYVFQELSTEVKRLRQLQEQGSSRKESLEKKMKTDSSWIKFK
ncbi:hypothetical protein HYFRA_00011592 [Hymenoscyphus fraxineus]|uniref:Uncharacterized protein n=1 Tax=Hymenoscyphus fraxineus TaxID=746836 RepID=A0A9N9PXD3_9HELO|nr:hypothetical protein HYFRA_00011592 [Hymenoscyphus fraxineus]